jgi:hypothetical protein
MMSALADSGRRLTAARSELPEPGAEVGTPEDAIERQADEREHER